MITVKKFYKEACAPCLSMGRILDKVSKNVDIHIKNIEVNQNPIEATNNDIQSVPTIIIELNGVEVTRWGGVKSSKEVKSIIDMYV